MLHKTDYVKEYKNGNIVIKYDSELIELAKKEPLFAIETALEGNDCYFIGETYCLGNYETGHTIYNAYSDLVYVFLWSELEELERGKTIRLYARKPNETDREILEKEGF